VHVLSSTCTFLLIPSPIKGPSHSSALILSDSGASFSTSTRSPRAFPLVRLRTSILEHVSFRVYFPRCDAQLCPCRSPIDVQLHERRSPIDVQLHERRSPIDAQLQERQSTSDVQLHELLALISPTCCPTRQPIRVLLPLPISTPDASAGVPALGELFADRGLRLLAP
jgi:hypothetical protein